MSSGRGTRIRIERERLGLSQSKLADLCGTSKGSQILYEKGRAPSADYLTAFDAVGGDVMFVLTGHHQGETLSVSRLSTAVRIVSDVVLPAPMLDSDRLSRLIIAVYDMLDGTYPDQEDRARRFLAATR